MKMEVLSTSSPQSVYAAAQFDVADEFPCENQAHPIPEMPPSRDSTEPPPSHAPLATTPTKPSTPLSSAASLSSSSSPTFEAPSSSAASAASLELKRESSEERERTRCDSLLNGGDARLSICSTSGTVYESVVVVGHIYGSDNVVYYLLEVKSWEAPLDGYVIRRRYNDFKELHRELALCMPMTGGVRRGNGSRPPQRGRFGVYGASSLLCNPLSTAQPEASPLWSPTRPRFDSHRRNSITGFRLHGVEESPHPLPSEKTPTENDTRFSAPYITLPPSRPPWSNSFGGIDLPFHSVSFDRSGRPILPPMPSGGVSSFFTSREMLIKYRIERFNRLLAAVLSDTSPSVAQLLMNFIQDKPSAPQTYVSLNQYAPVDIPWSVERHARRRAVSLTKKTIQNQMASAS